MINSTVDSYKFQLAQEYSNVLTRQGRARDTGAFNNTEQDMEAMCEAYKVFVAEAVAKAIDANNKKIYEDLKQLLNR
jgi:hypothetical protein